MRRIQQVATPLTPLNKFKLKVVVARQENRMRRFNVSWFRTRKLVKTLVRALVVRSVKSPALRGAITVIVCVLATSCLSTKTHNSDSLGAIPDASSCLPEWLFRPESGIKYPSPDDCWVYKKTEKRDLKLYLFQPSDTPKKAETLVFLFGGGWIAGSPQQLFDQARYFADLGYVGIGIDYRTTNQDGSAPNISLSDAKSAFRWIRSHSNQLGIDKDRIVAVGASAGGHLAAAAATVRGFDDPADDVSVSASPNVLVLYNPVIDNSPEGYGIEKVEPYWKRFSPMHNIAADHPPTLIILGTNDKFIPVDTGKKYCEKVVTLGGDCTLNLYQDQEHGFFNRTASSSEMYHQTNTDIHNYLMGLDGYPDEISE